MSIWIAISSFLRILFSILRIHLRPSVYSLITSFLSYYQTFFRHHHFLNSNPIKTFISIVLNYRLTYTYLYSLSTEVLKTEVVDHNGKFYRCWPPLLQNSTLHFSLSIRQNLDNVHFKINLTFINKLVYLCFESLLQTGLLFFIP